MKTLIILRGIPGSRKSTAAELLSENGKYPVCTSDDYFMVDGEYRFDMTKLGAAHLNCQKLAEKYMKEGHQKVFVANTNTTEKELNTYLRMAKANDYRVVSLVVENRHGNRSVHDVPEATLEAMKKDLSYNSDWKYPAKNYVIYDRQRYWKQKNSSTRGR